MSNKRVYASIITIGDELLIGQTIDTNSAWMAQELNKLGIWVKRRVAVGDVWDEIWNALDQESKQSQVILITGGLGPTADDITKPLLNEYFGGKLVVDQAALQNVKDIFEKYIKRTMLDVNLKQAEVPDVCTVIQNKRGTAPGMWFEKDGKVFISMPGVPNEMKGMMTDFVLPRLPKMFSLPAVVHRTLLTAGIGESYIADRIKDFEAALPGYIKLAYLPNFGMVRLRLTATGENESEITAEIDRLFVDLQSQLEDVMVINEDKNLEEAIGLMLAKHGKTLATAESCTGGYISHLITSVPGSSKYFKGGVVSYDNTVKENVLGVDADTLDNHGAVSEETVFEMATAAKELIKTDYALAVSGIMGPGGGTEEKPVGTVWVAVAAKSGTVTKRFQTRYDRHRNIEVTAINALNLLRQTILNDLKTIS
ncbi:competence/damage-inducible protein A [Segetibacter aerophilus]|uniref:CinA-like protein n=1 Tax=Segetibacter aerophilus TaxID=670293 RepID=A0A512BE27_9BACT|nr:competence/damage-inducible protein A [Segetibacter aerophilus]GEO10218.1 CinA-like protein [Segetibacter aerophilus]